MKFLHYYVAGRFLNTLHIFACRVSRAAVFSQLLMALEPSTLSPSGMQTGRRPPSLPRSASTNLSKCPLVWPTHEVSAQGISISPEYTSVIKEWLIPSTLKALRAFLGKCGYYRRFIADYGTISAPLVQYTKQDQHEGIPHLHEDFAAVKAFRIMKQKLMSAPILAYPQFHGKPFILDTDFSVDPGAIGSALSQEQDGQERVIAYGVWQLQPRERNYASTKGELLAVIFFLQYYKYYLLHRPFILRTDNWALTWLRSLESLTGMILRWLEILASFEFTVCHRKGTFHGNADSLSRAPHAALPTHLEEKS